MRIKIKPWEELVSIGTLKTIQHGKNMKATGIIFIYDDCCSVFWEQMKPLCGNIYNIDRYHLFKDGWQLDCWMFDVLEETTTISLNATEDLYICDSCGTTEILEQHNYCPMCGLKIMWE